ncbi:hypothetical protein [Streptomyces eurythermus]
MRTQDVVVRLDGVRKEYGETVALDGVSLEIRAGEAVAVKTVNSRRCWAPCRVRVMSRHGRTTRSSSWAARTW